MNLTTAAACVACSLLMAAGSAPAMPGGHVQGSVAADVRPLAGAWRSSEQFDNQARVTLEVQDDTGGLTGTLTLLGMTRGDDDRTTVRVPFRQAAWDGTTLSFETELPDGEGKAGWALRVTAPGKATLGPVTADGHPEEGAPNWEMSRR